MNIQSLLSRTAASLAIVRDDPASPPGVAIKHVAVFLSATMCCEQPQFQLHQRAFDGRTISNDVADWLGRVIPHGAEVALRASISMMDQPPSRKQASQWSPVAETAWLRPTFGKDGRIWPLHLSDKDIFESAKVMQLLCAAPGTAPENRARYAASEAQAIWHRFLPIVRPA